MPECEVSLDQMVRRVVRDMRPAYPATRVTFSELPIIDADPVAVQELLVKVIGHAFRYSALSPQPEVEISIDTKGALQVIDNGPGAPARLTVFFED
jgi:signal transduction histidine kinase